MRLGPRSIPRPSNGPPSSNRQAITELQSDKQLKIIPGASHLFEELGALEAVARLAREWDGPDAARHYTEFCLRNDIDEHAMHWKHAISWDMLHELRRDALVEIGAHTIMHARISTCTPQAATVELAGSRERLRERLGVVPKHFAFPYGRSGDCGERDFDLARQAGFLSAATTRKGIVRKEQDAFSLPRNTLNGAHRSLAMAELHLLGITGAAARILGRV